MFRQVSPRARHSHGLHRSSQARPTWRVRRLLFLERLEDRTLLASAVLAISVNDLLTYNASLGVTNALTVSYTSSNYTFTDLGETITLGTGTTGWTGSGTHTVTGPGTNVKSIAINTLDGNDSVAITSVAAPTSVSFTNSTGNADTVTLGGGSTGVQGVAGDVTVNNTSGRTALTVNDTNNTKAETVFLSDGQIANVEPYLIEFGSANLSSLTIMGSTALGTLNVNANDQGPVGVTAGLTTGSGTIAIGSDAPVNYSNFLAVNVSNAADQPLTQVSQTITTSTGDVPTEGKSFTYLATTLSDADLQSKTTGFVASIDWGDGTAPVAGSITADGSGQFQVSGSHTYQQAGAYPVVVSVTDLGATDTLSVGGIAVTISDVGGGGLTTGTVAQVNLVSNTPSIPAPITDTNLVNPWGIADDANGDAWVADEGSGVATYEGPGGSTPEGTAVIIPPASGAGIGSPAGIVYNSTSGFAIGGQSTSFLYATLDGTISGWNGKFPNSGSPRAVIAVNNSSSKSVYTGLAVASIGSQPLLYAANFESGQVEVYNSQFKLINTFTDSNWPNGYAPYNVQNIGGNLYVTFARQDQARTGVIPGLGNGFVDEFTPAGALVRRLITGAPLDAPWGVALAPANFGQYSGDVLVSNHGDGQIDAFNPANGQFLSVFADVNGVPITNDGLHGLIFGVGNSLYFTAGPKSGADGLFGSLTPSPDTVMIEPATLAASITSVTAFVNQPFDGVVATFTDANIYAVASDFTATVNWGDGSSDSSGDGNVTIIHTDGIGSSFIIQGLHTYATSTAGYPPFILTVTINEDNTDNSVFAQGTASVSNPTLHVAQSAITSIVNEPYTGAVATFTDDAPDPNVGDYSATINWGDGTSTAGAISLSNQAGQGYIITDGGLPPHVYTNATTGQAPYVVTVSVTKTTDDTLGAPVTETGAAISNVTVSNPTLHVTLSAITAIVGEPYTGSVATFTDDATDPNPGDYAATIDWGDGTTSAGTISLANQAGQGYIITDADAHTYASATTGQTPYVVTVDVTKVGTDTQGDELDESGEAIGNVAVAEPTLHVTLSGVSAFVDQPYLGPVATFTDDAPDPNLADYSATINWGDGQTSDGTISLANQSGQGYIVTDADFHTYAAATTGQAPYVVTVDVTKTAVDTQGDSLDESGTAIGNVAVSEPTLHATLSGFGAFVGQVYTGPAATFTDDAPDPNINDYSATINWGDGVVTAGTITRSNLAGQSFIVTDGGINGLLHTYAAATTGQEPYVVSVTITKTATNTQGFPLIESALAAGNVAVSQPALHATFTSFAAVAGSTYTGQIATFTDDMPIAALADNPGGNANLLYSASINWGDGVVSAGQVVASTSAAGSFIVSGTHTYMTPSVGTSPYVVTVTITKGLSPEYSIAAGNETVADALLYPINQNVALFTTEGASNTGVVGQFVDANPFVTAANFNGPGASQTVISWGDGKSSVGTISLAGGVFSVTGTHTYASPTPVGVPDTLSIAVTDQWGGKTTVTNGIAVTPAALTFTAAYAITRNSSTGMAITGGQSFTADIALFTSASPDATAGVYTASISWGDGTTTDTGTIKEDGSGVFHVSGTHTYSSAGTYPVTTTILAVGSAAPFGPAVTSNVTVVAPAAKPSAGPVTGIPIVGGDFIIAGQSFTTTVATFESSSSSATASTFSASIDWGDSSDDVTSGTVVQGANDPTTGAATFFVIGTHIYDKADEYNFTVYVSVPGAASIASDPTVAIAYAPTLITHSAPIAGVQGEELPDGTALATFTDPEFMSDPEAFASGTDATVNWGDGTSGTVNATYVGTSPTGTGFVIYDTHYYDNITDVFQAYQVSVTIVTPDGSAAVINDLAQLTVPVLTDPPIAVHAIAGSSFTAPVATIHTTNSLTTAADFTGTIEWGDGQSSSAALQSEGGGTFVVLGSHSYAGAGTFLISFSLSDQNGNTVDDTTTATVIVPPSPAAASIATVQPMMNHKNLVDQVDVVFGSPVDATLAAETGIYRLVSSGKHGTFAGRAAQVIRIGSVTYDAVDNMVVLTPIKPFSLSKPVELQIGGESRSILKASRRSTVALAGKHALEKVAGIAHPVKSVAPTLSTSRTSNKLRPEHAAQIDVLLERDELVDLRRSSPDK